MSSTDIVIHSRGLTKKFGDLLAVDHLDLDVRRTEIFGFLGANGSGKSTAIRMLCGLLRPTSGEIEVLGCRIPRDVESLKGHIGYMTQKFSLYEDLSVAENLEFLGRIHGIRGQPLRSRVDEMFERYRLTELRQQLAGTLSGGQKQRLALAGAVLHRPNILLLDEPTSAVDPKSRRDFWDSLFELAEGGATLLVSTHYMDEAKRCTRLCILDAGRVAVDGSPQDLMRSLPGRALLIECDEPRRVQRLLEEVDEVIGMSQIGGTLRVLCADPEVAVDLKPRLARCGVEVTITLAEPNLEDVFVNATCPRSVA
ncbi:MULTISPECIES: ABC transporter ATP-binding protein [Pseudomonas nitroreducens/multiresinivorans group]|uniref:ABC transporter ATP-binding protein n=1 Tax=Pseudomonas nitroreducens/multiresinivorans group TaxID=627141 RepID=UPI001473031F|nr:ABC transporter ATP-binding protein [Pseudomonas multiresinivorans]